MKMNKSVLLLVLPIAILGGCTKTTTVTTGSTAPEDYIINSLNYDVISELFTDGGTDATFAENVRVPTFTSQGSFNPVTSLYDVQCDNGGTVSYTFSTAGNISGTTTTNVYTFEVCELEDTTITGIIEVEKQASVANEVVATTAKFLPLADGTQFSFFNAGVGTVKTTGVTKTWKNGNGISVKIPGTFSLNGVVVSGYEMTDAGDILKGTVNADVLGYDYGNVTFNRTDDVVTLSATDKSSVRIEDTGKVSLRNSDKSMNQEYTVTSYGTAECKPLLDGASPCVIELDVNAFRTSVVGTSALKAAQNTLTIAKTNLDIAIQAAAAANSAAEGAGEDVGVYRTLGEDDNLAELEADASTANAKATAANKAVEEATKKVTAADAAVKALSS